MARVIDGDAHIMGPRDWLPKFFPGLAAEHAELQGTQASHAITAAGALPRALPLTGYSKMKILGRAAPPATHLAEFERQAADLTWDELESWVRSDEFDCEWGSHLARYGANDPVERLAVMDRGGIDVQFVSPTMAPPLASDESLDQRTLTAFHTWFCELLAPHNDRLVPVVLLRGFSDHDIDELRRTRELGARAVQMVAVPPDGKSWAHPDWDWLWSLLEELGMLVQWHTAVGAEGRFSKAHGNVGERETSNWMTQQIGRVMSDMGPIAPLVALITGGVFERHPRLFVLIAEGGVSWVAPFLESLDLRCGGGHAAIYDNRYDLPLRPSEYAARQLRVSTLRWDALRPWIDLTPPGVITFGSDFPHPEGSEDAVELFAPQVAHLDQQSQDRFWGSLDDFFVANDG